MLLSYAVTRLRFNKGFEPSGDGFIYRAKTTGPAIAISRAEKEELLREFRRLFWRQRLGLLGATVALVFLLAVLDLLLVPIEATEMFVTIGVLVIAVPLIAAAFVLDKRLFELPARKFSNRKPVASGRTWREAYDERAHRRSASYYVLWALMLVGLAWLFFPRAHVVWWALPAWIAYFSLAFVVLSYNLWRKYQYSRSRED